MDEVLIFLAGAMVGQIIMVGMLSETNDKTFLFGVDNIEADFISSLNANRLPPELNTKFGEQGYLLSSDLDIRTEIAGEKWMIGDRATDLWFAIASKPGISDQLFVYRRTSPLHQQTHHGTGFAKAATPTPFITGTTIQRRSKITKSVKTV